MRVRILCRWIRLSSLSTLSSFTILSPSIRILRPLSLFCSLFLSFFSYPRLSRSCFGQVTGTPALVTSPRINSRSELGVCATVGRLQLHARANERACSQTWRCIALSARNLGVALSGPYHPNIYESCLLASRLYDAEFHPRHAVKKHAFLARGASCPVYISHDL